MMSKPKVLSTSVLAESRLFRIESMDIAFSNGKTANFECTRTKGDGVVMVAPINSNKELILVREYAACADRYEMGFVKGRIDPGETPEQAAGRELKEEIGYGAKQLQLKRSVTMSPGYTNSLTWLFVATDLYAEDAEGDEVEPLIQTKWPLENLSALHDHPEITDARVLLLISMLEAIL